MTPAIMVATPIICPEEIVSWAITAPATTATMGLINVCVLTNAGGLIDNNQMNDIIKTKERIV